MRKSLVRFAVCGLTALIGAAGVSLRPVEKKLESQAPQAEINVEPNPIRKMFLSELDPDLPRSLSPYDIRSFVSNEPNLSLFKLWKALKIDPNGFDGMISNNPGFFPGTCDNCGAQIWEYDLDGEAGNEALLRIAESTQQYCRYLIFKQVDSEQWKLVGHIDAWGKYRAPQHIVIVNRGVVWLAIQNQSASGSGVESYINFVYLVTPTRVVKGFSYIADGSQSGGPESFGHDFSGRVVDCKVKDGVVTVEFAYSVRYWSGQSLMFSQQHRVVFTNRVGEWNSRFDSARSNIARDEFESVYNIDTLANEDFLHYSSRELSQIARGRDIERKESLRELLKNCENTPERRQLSQLLDAN